MAEQREPLSDLINKAPPHALQDAFTQAAQQVPADEYREHIMPGLGGTDPLGSLARGALPVIAGALINAYLNSRRAPSGAPTTGGAPFPTGPTSGTGGMGGLGDLINMLPGLQTTNPQQMSPNDVAILADYLRQHHPDAFGKAATDVGRQDPDLL
jgi:hypothetical protein